MIPFRRVLVPVDYSKPCEEMSPHVKQLVRHFRAELTLLHAHSPYNPAYRALLASNPGWPPQMKAFEERRLKGYSATHFPDEKVETRAVEGEPGSVIREFVECDGTDLVMLPTRGNGPVRRFLLGSVTAKVLHDVCAPVWTATPAALAVVQPIRTILCALDAGEESEAVLRGAAILANSYQATLLLVHTVLAPPVAANIGFRISRKEMLDAGERCLRDLKIRVNVDAPHTVVESTLAEGLRDEAQRVKADLLVVGRGNAQGMMPGLCSRLYPLIREAPCPVISI
jgi:nucleotide-binding universal stress UspA family protein